MFGVDERCGDYMFTLIYLLRSFAGYFAGVECLGSGLRDWFGGELPRRFRLLFLAGGIKVYRYHTIEQYWIGMELEEPPSVRSLCFGISRLSEVACRGLVGISLGEELGTLGEEG